MKHTHRLPPLPRIALLIGTLFLFQTTAARAEDSAVPEQDPRFLAAWSPADSLIEAYGDTDWSDVTAALVANPIAEANGPVFLIPLALGNAFLDRYGLGRDSGDSERALQYFQSVADGYGVWDRRLRTPTVAHALAVSVERMEASARCGGRWQLPPVQRKQVNALRAKVDAILAAEADHRMTRVVSDRADDCIGGESGSTVDAWEAALLADAATALPDDARASTWKERARELVERAASSADEECEADGDDLEAVLLALTRIDVPDRIVRRKIVRKLRPVVDELIKVTNLDEADSDKDPGSRKGYRGKPMEPMPRVATANDLLEAVLESKVLVESMLASSLTLSTPVLECDEVRYSMPEVGEVR